MSRDVTTMQGSPARTPAPPTQRVVGLTLLLHSDPSRVGQWCQLPPSSHLSRLEPEFAAPGLSGERERETRQPLSDPNISRRPVRIQIERSGSVKLTPASGGSEVVVDGRVLDGPMTLSEAAVDKGVTVELKSRVVLLLHRRIAPVADLDGLGLDGQSESLDRLRQQILRVADLDVPVLLRGPTGAGKELVARAIHDKSARSSEALVAVNLVTLPGTTAASALFGHEKGAFTGADAKHRGFFVQADRGTLFLDEVAETSTEVQAMLLRVLETGEVQALGSVQGEKVSVRLIAATDANLESLMFDGKFREPLLHRLAGFQITVPALSERRDDIARLLVHFLDEELRNAKEPNRLRRDDPAQALWLPAQVITRLTSYPWPGNVRELRNVARHIVIANRGCEEVVDDEFLQGLCGDLAPAPSSAGGAKARPAQISEQELIDSLRRNAWRTGATATELGMSRTTLYAMMDRCDKIRKAKDLGAEEIRRIHDESGGDLETCSQHLEVSERGLKLRIKELGLDLG